MRKKIYTENMSTGQESIPLEDLMSNTEPAESKFVSGVDGDSIVGITRKSTKSVFALSEVEAGYYYNIYNGNEWERTQGNFPDDIIDRDNLFEVVF